MGNCFSSRRDYYCYVFFLLLCVWKNCKVLFEKARNYMRVAWLSLCQNKV